MKKRCNIIMFLVVIVLVSMPIKIYADSSKVVTIGADLSDKQKEVILSYFGTTETEVQLIEVTNEDERKYMEGIATEQQIGTHTYSCSYIEPTNEGGINIKTANLNWVTCEMIRNALITSGIVNCNVISAAPMEVSGTGALTGIFMAYEQVVGDELDKEKINIASEELITTADIAGDIGQTEASTMVEELKEVVIEGKIDDENKITDTIDNYTNENKVELTEEQKDALIKLLLKIANQDYDIDKIKEAYQRVEDKIDDIKEKSEETLGLFERIGKWISNLLSSTSDNIDNQENNKVEEDKNSIIFNTNDSALGDDTIVTTTASDNNTDSNKENTVEETKPKKGLLSFILSLLGIGEETPEEDNKQLEKSTEISTEETTEEINENATEISDKENNLNVLDKVTYSIQEDPYNDSVSSLNSLTE